MLLRTNPHHPQLTDCVLGRTVRIRHAAIERVRIAALISIAVARLVLAITATSAAVAAAMMMPAALAVHVSTAATIARLVATVRRRCVAGRMVTSRSATRCRTSGRRMGSIVWGSGTISILTTATSASLALGQGGG